MNNNQCTKVGNSYTGTTDVNKHFRVSRYFNAQWDWSAGISETIETADDYKYVITGKE